MPGNGDIGGKKVGGCIEFKLLSYPSEDAKRNKENAHMIQLTDPTASVSGKIIFRCVGPGVTFLGTGVPAGCKEVEVVLPDAAVITPVVRIDW